MTDKPLPKKDPLPPKLPPQLRDRPCRCCGDPAMDPKTTKKPVGPRDSHVTYPASHYCKECYNELAYNIVDYDPAITHHTDGLNFQPERQRTGRGRTGG